MKQRHTFQFKLGRDEDSDPVNESLINRFIAAGWIDAVIELPQCTNFHFTKLGKKRFRALHAATDELERDLDILDKEERAELIEMVEAWIEDVNTQKD